MRMRYVPVKMPDVLVDRLDQLVREGIFSSRSEAIRYAVMLLLRDYESKRGKMRYTAYKIIRLDS